MTGQCRTNNDAFVNFFARCVAALVVAGVSAPALADADATPRKHRQMLLIEGNRKLAARQDYQTHCASCHGVNGDGQTIGVSAPATDFTTPKAVAELDRNRMVAAVRTGHGNVVRDDWLKQLDEQRTAAVIDYIREAFMLPAPVADASLGRKFYARTCSVCHGERGDGASWAQNSLYPPPLDFRSPGAKKLTRQEMINAVKFGVRGTAMMPFATQLTDEEIPAVVDYIRETFIYRGSQEEVAQSPGWHPTEPLARAQQHASTSPSHRDHGHGSDGAAFDMDAGFPASLVGDATSGKALYDKNCTACHGKTGDGKGPRAYFMTRKPADFSSPRARSELNRPHLFQAIAKGVKRTEMPAWSKVLDSQQIANIAEYVFGAFIKPGHASPAHGHAKPHSHEPHSHENGAAKSKDTKKN